MPHDGFSLPDQQQQNGRFTLGNFTIDEYRPIKVIVIGAGFSGILAGIRCVAGLKDHSVNCDILNGISDSPRRYPTLA